MKRFILMAFYVLSISIPITVKAQEIERDPDFVAGRVALEDGFYDVAASRLEKFVNSTLSTRKKANASVFLFRAWYGLGDNQKIIDWLRANWQVSKGTRYESAYQYWYAQAKYSLGEYSRSLEYLKDYEKKFPKDEFYPYMLRLKAQAMRENRQLGSAEELFAQYDREFPGRSDIPDNLLDWAGVLIQLNRKDDAKEKLEILVRDYGTSPASRNARVWLGEAAIESGNPEEAMSWLTPITLDEQADPSTRASAWFSMASSFVTRGDITNALSALSQGELLSTNAERKVEARIDQARLLMGLNRLNDAIQIMDETVFTLATQPQAARAQLELSDLLRAQKQFEKATEAYQRYLESFSDPAGQRHALYSKAWCLWELGRYAEAALAFEKAYNALSNQALREQSLIKSADSYYMNGQYRLAATAYEKAMSEFMRSPEYPDMMYQTAESYARAGDSTNAVAYLLRIVASFPDKDIAQVSMKRLARFYEEQKKWDNAISTLDEFLVRFKQSDRYPEVMFDRAMLYYRLARYQDSLTDFERLREEFPDTPVAMRADFMRGWCLYQLGDTARAIQIGNKFLSRNKDSEWAPEVAFWLAEHEFNTLNYGVAESNFVAIAKSSPSNYLAEKSVYWAGRSAVEQKAYRRAIDYFTQLTRQYTNSVLIPEARFAQGDALTEIGDFAGAILAYEEIIKLYPGSPLVVRALGRIGDCQFTLGSDRPERYQDSIASLRAVLTHPMVTRDLALQAEYKLARAYEKLGRSEEAVNHYLNVVYDWLAGREAGIPVDEVWFVRSAFSAATLKESTQAWGDAITIYNRVIDSGITAGKDARIRIDRIVNQRQKNGAPSSGETR